MRDVLTDAEWAEMESRRDFRLIDSVMEIANFNMYTAIEVDRTKQLYHTSARAVAKATGSHTLAAAHFDFSKW